MAETVTTYRVKLIGVQPLLLHADDLDWSDIMEGWRQTPENVEHSKPGDDRTPAFRWIGSLYRTRDGVVALPTENILRSFTQAAAAVPIPGGKRGASYKVKAASALLPKELGWPITINGKPVPVAPIDALMEEANFKVHEEKVKAMGFTLFKKRARIGSSKHVRVRPRFETWEVEGDLMCTDKDVSERALLEIASMAGRTKGVGDWRPSSPRAPGPYGMFRGEVRILKAA